MGSSVSQLAAPSTRMLVPVLGCWAPSTGKRSKMMVARQRKGAGNGAAADLAWGGRWWRAALAGGAEAAPSNVDINFKHVPLASLECLGLVLR